MSSPGCHRYSLVHVNNENMYWYSFPSIMSYAALSGKSLNFGKIKSKPTWYSDVIVVEVPLVWDERNMRTLLYGNAPYRIKYTVPSA